MVWKKKTARATFRTIRKTTNTWLKPEPPKWQECRANPGADVFGETSGDVLVVSWGRTYGACHTAVAKCRDAGHSVSHAHIRYMNPLPRNIGDLLSSFRKVLVPELNTGQLRMLLRSEYLVDCVGINKVKGKPFAVSELVEEITHHAATLRKVKAG